MSPLIAELIASAKDINKSRGGKERMPEVLQALRSSESPLQAKDDFNDFSTHHHSQLSFVRNLVEISRGSPSERETMIDARESIGSVEKQERGSLASVCSFCIEARLASMIGLQRGIVAGM